MTDESVDLSPFFCETPDSTKIHNGKWVPCRVCENVEPPPGLSMQRDFVMM